MKKSKWKSTSSRARDHELKILLGKLGQPGTMECDRGYLERWRLQCGKNYSAEVAGKIVNVVTNKEEGEITGESVDMKSDFVEYVLARLVCRDKEAEVGLFVVHNPVDLFHDRSVVESFRLDPDSVEHYVTNNVIDSKKYFKWNTNGE